MKLDDSQIGQVVPGTYLKYLGPVPRKSSRDRNARGLFECVYPNPSKANLRCGKVKEIRIDSVGPHHTVSCGCVSKQRCNEYYRKRESNHAVLNKGPHRSAEDVIDAEMEAAVEKYRKHLESWIAMRRENPKVVWVSSPLSAKEEDLVNRYFEIINRRSEELDLKLEREERWSRNRRWFRDEEQRQAWLKSDDPKMRLDAAAAGFGESAREAREELRRLLKQEHGFTEEDLMDPNSEIEFG